MTRMFLKRSIKLAIGFTTLIAALFILYTLDTNLLQKKNTSSKNADVSLGKNISKKTARPTIPTPIIDEANKIPVDLSNNSVAIPELGIKFNLPDGLQDIVYSPQSKSVFLSTATLSNKGVYCVASKAPMGSISIVNKSEVSKVHLDTDNWIYQEEALKKYSSEWIDEPSGEKMQPFVKEFDTFYIVFQRPQATCSDDKSVQDLQTLLIKTAQDIIPTVEKL